MRWGNCNLIPTQHMPGHPGHPHTKEADWICFGKLGQFCFVLFALQLSVCLWWHDYRRDVFPTLKFGVVMADLLTIC